jgi:hypothetical protein
MSNALLVKMIDRGVSDIVKGPARGSRMKIPVRSAKTWPSRKVDRAGDSIDGKPTHCAMAQRHMCPSMGVLRRSLAADMPSMSKTLSRALSGSARRLEEQPSNATPSNPGMHSLSPTSR